MLIGVRVYFYLVILEFIRVLLLSEWYRFILIVSVRYILKIFLLFIVILNYLSILFNFVVYCIQLVYIYSVFFCLCLEFLVCQ